MGAVVRNGTLPLLLLIGSGCAPVYSVRLELAPDVTSEGRLIEGTAHVSPLGDDSVAVMITVSSSAPDGKVVGCFPRDIRPSEVRDSVLAATSADLPDSIGPLIEARRTPRGWDVLTIRTTRETLADLDGEEFEVTSLNPPYSDFSTCRDLARLDTQRYRFTSQSGSPGGGVAALVLLLAVGAGIPW